MSAPLRSGERLATGTGAARRRLTLEEAEAGCLPEPFTRAEWAEMAAVCQAYHDRLVAEAAARHVASAPLRGGPSPAWALR